MDALYTRKRHEALRERSRRGDPAHRPLCLAADAGHGVNGREQHVALLHTTNAHSHSESALQRQPRNMKFSTFERRKRLSSPCQQLGLF
eukprot:1158127-Pelagomonas_calceolata.AAC.3